MELRSAFMWCFRKYVKTLNVANYQQKHTFHEKAGCFANSKRLRQAWNGVNGAWGYQNIWKCNKMNMILINIPYWYQIGYYTPIILPFYICMYIYTYNMNRPQVLLATLWPDLFLLDMPFWKKCVCHFLKLVIDIWSIFYHYLTIFLITIWQ